MAHHVAHEHHATSEAAHGLAHHEQAHHAEQSHAPKSSQLPQHPATPHGPAAPATMLGHVASAIGDAALRRELAARVESRRAEADHGKRASHDDVSPAALSASSGGAVDAGTLEAFISHNEGRRHHVYVDTMGHPTVGIGFNLDRSSAPALLAGVGANYDRVREGLSDLTDKQIDALFRNDAADATHNAQHALGGTFDQLSEARKIVVIDMEFNLGAAGFAAFQKMIAALKRGDYAEAANQMVDSAWYGQTGQRAKRDVRIMRSGRLEGGEKEPPQAGPIGADGGVEVPSTPTHTPGQWTPAPSLEAVRAGQAVLHIGQAGPAVVHVQRQLGTDADGRFGELTRQSVVTFQRHHLRLRHDGVVDKETLRLIDKHPPGFGEGPAGEKH